MVAHGRPGAEAQDFSDEANAIGEATTMDVIIARALHVLAVVIWIGGISTATTMALPAVRGGILGENRLQAFQAIEHRFAWQARTAALLVAWDFMVKLRALYLQAIDKLIFREPLSRPARSQAAA